MRIKVKEMPKEGDIRTIARFQFLPIRVGNQIVWFENVKVKQRAKRFVDMTCGCSSIEWIDDEITLL